ncbi:MAG: 2Fe-2S iron-sulfur cluster binding domain-containing protein, partial [Limnohabitans sp.]|nr:2Fe-2S iron-sulfur cluster binding domain-containing protein [Limnohabitans sp.]
MSHVAPITFTLDGQTIPAQAGDSIWQAAKRQGIEIPHLCHSEGLRADGNCRACVVEVKGERALSASCCRQATQGLEVLLQTERVQHSQKMVVELLLSDMPDQGHKWSSDEVGA